VSLGVFKGLGDRSVAQKTNDNTIKKSKHVYTNMKNTTEFSTHTTIQKQSNHI